MKTFLDVFIQACKDFNDASICHAPRAFLVARTRLEAMMEIMDTQGITLLYTTEIDEEVQAAVITEVRSYTDNTWIKRSVPNIRPVEGGEEV